MATIVERLQIVIDTVERGAASAIRGIGDESEKASVKTRLLEGAQRQLGVETLTTKQALLGAGVAAGAFVGTQLVQYVAGGIEQFTSLAAEVRDFQRASGASAEDASRWVAALDDMQVSADAGEKAAFKLNREIGNGGAKLAEFNIEIARNKDGTADLSTTLENVAEAYVQTADSGERARMVAELFGRAGKDLIPILEQGKKGIQELFEGAESGHQIFSQEDLTRAREYELALDDLNDTFRGLQMEAGKVALPVVTGYANALSNTVQFADEFTATLDRQRVSFAGVTVSAKDAGEAYVEAGVKSLPVVGTLASVGDALGDVTGLWSSGSEEADKYSDAQKNVQDATRTLANALSDHGRGSREARDAEKELGAAQKELAGYNKDLESSLQGVNDKLQDHATKAYLAQQADLAAGGAKLGLERAVSGVGSAMDNYNATLYGNAVAGDTSKAAQERLNSAHQVLVGSTLAALQAAGEKAIADAGPNAGAAEKAKAATDAQKQALDFLEATFPGLRAQVQGYVGDIETTPPAKSTKFWADVGDAIGQIESLKAALASVDRSITIGVNVIANTTVDAIRREFN